MPVPGTFAAASARGFGFGTEDMFGEQIFSAPGTYTFYVPAGVTSISVVSIGGGGGGGRHRRRRRQHAVVGRDGACAVASNAPF